MTFFIRLSSFFTTTDQYKEHITVDPDPIYHSISHSILPWLIVTRQRDIKLPCTSAPAPRGETTFLLQTWRRCWLSSKWFHSQLETWVSIGGPGLIKPTWQHHLEKGAMLSSSNQTPLGAQLRLDFLSLIVMNVWQLMVWSLGPQQKALATGSRWHNFGQMVGTHDLLPGSLELEALLDRLNIATIKTSGRRHHALGTRLTSYLECKQDSYSDRTGTRPCSEAASLLSPGTKEHS